MDIFEFAMQKENEAEKLYRGLADDAPTEGLKNAFSRLADNEQKHYEVVKAMQEQTGVQLDVPVLDDATYMFNRLKADRQALLDTEENQVEVYKKARGMEESSMKFYQEKADEIENPLQKKILEQLAQQEKMHYILMDNMVDFVEKPENWIENAEFTHILEKYAGTDYYPEGI
jgi:rubrerythrin